VRVRVRAVYLDGGDMPRPKSEMTSVTTSVSARLMPLYYAEWKRLGGVLWLRKVLKENMEKRRREDADRNSRL
jgi:hypothetical protein